MLCNTCRRSLLARFRAAREIEQLFPSRSIATTGATSSTIPLQPPPSKAISGATQHASSTLGNSQTSIAAPSPSSSMAETTSRTARKGMSIPNKLKGSIPGGAELRGIAYLKAKSSVVALEDDEYPQWLWRLLSDNKTVTGEPKVDLAAMTKKQRGKYDRKQERLAKGLAKPVPVHEQSTNLTGPGDDAVVSLERRQEITKSARIARRKGIRESNFLKGM